MSTGVTRGSVTQTITLASPSDSSTRPSTAVTADIGTVLENARECAALYWALSLNAECKAAIAKSCASNSSTDISNTDANTPGSSDTAPVRTSNGNSVTVSGVTAASGVTVSGVTAPVTAPLLCLCQCSDAEVARCALAAVANVCEDVAGAHAALLGTETEDTTDGTGGNSNSNSNGLNVVHVLVHLMRSKHLAVHREASRAIANLLSSQRAREQWILEVWVLTIKYVYACVPTCTSIKSPVTIAAVSYTLTRTGLIVIKCCCNTEQTVDACMRQCMSKSLSSAR